MSGASLISSPLTPQPPATCGAQLLFSTRDVWGSGRQWRRLQSHGGQWPSCTVSQTLQLWSPMSYLLCDTAPPCQVFSYGVTKAQHQSPWSQSIQEPGQVSAGLTSTQCCGTLTLYPATVAAVGAEGWGNLQDMSKPRTNPQRRPQRGQQTSSSQKERGLPEWLMGTSLVFQSLRIRLTMQGT